jgi:hypothetical protein
MKMAGDSTKAYEYWQALGLEMGWLTTDEKPPVAEIIASLANRSAPAVDAADIAQCAATLGVSEKHIVMLRKVESGGKSFDDKGRPLLLPEPHVFSRLTNRAFDISHPDISYPTWGKRPYPSSYDGRWQVLERMAGLSLESAFGATSWGLFQIMGFHAASLGYGSALAMVREMVDSEAAHYKAMVKFIIVNGLADELRACVAGNPDSCRAFAAGYNGRGYEKNNYHVKMAEALK